MNQAPENQKIQNTKKVINRKTKTQENLKVKKTNGNDNQNKNRRQEKTQINNKKNKPIIEKFNKSKIRKQ